jgi:hypothetical protein
VSDTHHCAIEGCHQDNVPLDRIMCSKHWARVPRDLQNSVYKWQKVSAKQRRIMPEHVQALRAAIAAVNDFERNARITAEGRRTMQFPGWFDGNTNGIR